MRLVVFAVCIGFAFLVGVNRSDGATFNVDSTLDAPDAAPGDGICAAASGNCTLRAAVEEANALAGTDAISLPSGRLRLSLGELDISTDVDVSGPGATTCIVRGNLRSRLVHVALGSTVTLAGVSLQRGSADVGGAILNDGTLTLNDAAVQRSRAKRFDGGQGGGIFNNGTLVLNNVTIKGNRAYGCICSFGGGLFNNGSAVLNRVVVSHNAVSGCGGGVFGSTGTLRIIDSTFEFNNVSNSGGGLYHQEGVAQVSNSLFRENRANKIGGGIFTYAELHLTNSTLGSNSSRIGGGLFSAVTPVADLINVTIAFNRAKDGAGIHNDDTTSLYNTIVSNNSPHNCDGFLVSSNGHNLSGDATCMLTGPEDQNGSDPQLIRVHDNGGPTLTYALSPGSPALDAGDNLNCPSTDQRGVVRPQDGNLDGTSTCDVGAFELSP